ncbi:MAG: 4'-phosphopantetheinyl transferase family protein [Agathobacter sp.]
MMRLYVAEIGCLDDSRVFESYLCKVNEQRRTKVLRCKNEEDRKRTLLAGALLSFGLEREGLCYEDLEFATTSEGKPYLVSNPDVHFSLSHSGKYAVCVIADHNIGVDVENRQRKLLSEGKPGKILAIARKSFSDREYQVFVNSSGEEQIEMFLKCWTRKEAVSKAYGKGLAMDFSKICEPDEKFLSFWLNEEYYISVYCEKDKLQKEELEICMMN